MAKAAAHTKDSDKMMGFFPGGGINNWKHLVKASVDPVVGITAQSS
jgi:hypothetical protein